MKMEQTECSETLAYKFQKPVNNPEKATTFRTRRKFQIKKRKFVTVQATKAYRGIRSINPLIIKIGIRWR
jgi:hypothetical protein